MVEDRSIVRLETGEIIGTQQEMADKARAIKDMVLAGYYDDLPLRGTTDLVARLAATQQYLRRAIEDEALWLDSQNHLAEARLHKIRQAGRELDAMEKNQGGRPLKNPLCNRRGLPATTSDFGLTDNRRHRWTWASKPADDLYAIWKQKIIADRQELTLNGLVNFAAELLQKAKHQETAEAPLPQGQYRCIVIDPPWPIHKINRTQARPLQGESLDYTTMTVEEMADEERLPIRESMFPDGCHIYLWVTQKYLPDGLGLLKKWGVNYQCVMTWVKNVGFTPFSWMYSTEHVLFGTVGDLPLLRKGLRLDFTGKVREHSRKPDEFYALVREASPEPRREMFARQARDGFDVWGNETGRFGERMDAGQEAG